MYLYLYLHKYVNNTCINTSQNDIYNSNCLIAYHCIDNATCSNTYVTYNANNDKILKLNTDDVRTIIRVINNGKCYPMTNYSTYINKTVNINICVSTSANVGIWSA